MNRDPKIKEVQQVATRIWTLSTSTRVTSPAIPARPSFSRRIIEGISLRDFGQLAQFALRNLVSMQHCYVLHHHLSTLSPKPPRKLGGGQLRLLDANDIAGLYEQGSALDFKDKLNLLVQLRFYENGFTNCYGLVENGSISYLQWMIGPEENELIRAKYGHCVLPVGDKEILIDNAFTLPSYRGRGYMSYAVWELLSRAKESGYRRAVTYVRKDNINSLNVLTTAGFRFTKLVREWKLMGHSWRNL